MMTNNMKGYRSWSRWHDSVARDTTWYRADQLLEVFQELQFSYNNNYRPIYSKALKSHVSRAKYQKFFNEGHAICTKIEPFPKFKLVCAENILFSTNLQRLEEALNVPYVSPRLSNFHDAEQRVELEVREALASLIETLNNDKVVLDGKEFERQFNLNQTTTASSHASAQ